jgi:hypothetical protein
LGEGRGGVCEFLHCGDNLFFAKCGKFAKLSKTKKLEKRKENHACHK